MNVDTAVSIRYRTVKLNLKATYKTGSSIITSSILISDNLHKQNKLISGDYLSNINTYCLEDAFFLFIFYLTFLNSFCHTKVPII